MTHDRLRAARPELCRLAGIRIDENRPATDSACATLLMRLVGRVLSRYALWERSDVLDESTACETLRSAFDSLTALQNATDRWT